MGVNPKECRLFFRGWAINKSANFRQEIRVFADPLKFAFEGAAIWN
jgi:hypothetical protein